jgi:hypothetical protein
MVRNYDNVGTQILKVFVAEIIVYQARKEISNECHHIVT